MATGETVEAGIDARGAATSWNVPVELSFEEEIDLGVALLNLSDEAARIGISLYTAGERFDSTEVVLAPKARTAFFVTELLPKTQAQNIGNPERESSRPAIVATRPRQVLKIRIRPLNLGARGLKLGIPMSFATSLECSRCREAFSPDELHGVCSRCESPLLVRYDLERAAAGSLREEFLRRPPSLWRYLELLPVRDPDSIVSMGEGMTPLVQLKPTFAEGSVAQLWLKDESCNPTGSFKARGLSAAVTMAASFGVRRLCVPSAGNAGGALAAYAARCGLESYVFIPKDTPSANIVECRLAATRVEMVDGTISDAASAMRHRRGDRDWFDVSTLREPYRIEGKKTLGYEIAEQLGWRLPDVILYPTGGGTGLIGMWKAFREMEAMGWVEGRLPRMVAVQSEGCAPIVKAFEEGRSHAEPWPDPKTAAAGIRVPQALGDFLILRAIRESGGVAVAVSEASIQKAVRQAAAREGVWMCPEGAACWAAFRELLQTGWIQPDAVVVLFNTAAGHKYLDSLRRISRRVPKERKDWEGGG